MGCDERSKVVLENVTVEVFADIQDVSSLHKQCLTEDNPGKVRVTQFGYPDHTDADIVVWVIEEGPHKYGFLARLVKTMYDNGLQSYADQAGNMVYWSEGML